MIPLLLYHITKELSSTSTRANISLSYINFPTVKSQIFYELIDKDLIELMFAAADLQNYQLIMIL